MIPGQRGRHRIGCVVDTFDLFHVGHLDLLALAAERCDQLVVALPGDRLVESRTGARPFVPQAERAGILSAVRCVSRVELLHGLDLGPVLAATGASGVLVAAQARQDALAAELYLPGEVPVTWLPGRRTTRSLALTTALARGHRVGPAGAGDVGHDRRGVRA